MNMCYLKLCPLIVFTFQKFNTDTYPNISEISSKPKDILKHLETASESVWEKKRNLIQTIQSQLESEKANNEFQRDWK